MRPAPRASASKRSTSTSGAADAALVQDVKLELTGSLRLKALQAAGVDPLSAARIETLAAPGRTRLVRTERAELAGAFEEALARYNRVGCV